MKMGIGPKIELKRGFQFTCFVCQEPIRLKPMTKLPVNEIKAFKDLQAGEKPVICCSCGGIYTFKGRSAAFRRYVQFLALHLPDEKMCEELEEMFE